MNTKFIVVVSLVIEHNGCVLLVRRNESSDHAPGEWETVSGRIESGETPAAAARREALEETGLQVDILELLDSFHFFRGASREEAIGVTFHCHVTGGQLRLSEEHSAFVWVSKDRARSYALPKGLLRCIDTVFE